MGSYDSKISPPVGCMLEWLPFKSAKKLKMSSAEVVCCTLLPNITDLFKYNSKQINPNQTVCPRGFLKFGYTTKRNRLLLRLAL